MHDLNGSECGRSFERDQGVGIWNDLYDYNYIKEERD